MDSAESNTTRRLLIGGSIAGLGSAVTLATAGPAVAAGGGDGRSSTGEPAGPVADSMASLPALGAGEQTLYFGPLGWAAYAFAAGATVVIGGGSGSQASSGWLGRSVDLPNGSTITGMDVTFAGSTVSGSAFLMKSTPDTSPSWSIAANVSAAAPGTVSVNTSQAVTTGTAFSIEVSALGTTFVSGARIRYTPPVPSGLNLVAITPSRVYDSRLNMAPDANGVMGPGSNRTISVANGRNPSTGVVNLANVVPTTAKAIAYTVTVAGTTGNGFLAVNPGGDTTVHASTINWSAGQSLANSGVIAISPTRTITMVRGGSGVTHVIVDVIGYYVQ